MSLHPRFGTTLSERTQFEVPLKVRPLGLVCCIFCCCNHVVLLFCFGTLILASSTIKDNIVLLFRCWRRRALAERKLPYLVCLRCDFPKFLACAQYRLLHMRSLYILHAPLHISLQDIRLCCLFFFLVKILRTQYKRYFEKKKTTSLRALTAKAGFCLKKYLCGKASGSAVKGSMHVGRWRERAEVGREGKKQRRRGKKDDCKCMCCIPTSRECGAGCTDSATSMQCWQRMRRGTVMHGVERIWSGLA